MPSKNVEECRDEIVSKIFFLRNKFECSKIAEDCKFQWSCNSNAKKVLHNLKIDIFICNS